jgi:lipopolysaccharide export system protein LptC
MSIDLPNSTLDLTTSVISTKKLVTIKRADFELTGNTMEFNTKTRAGGLGGKVRMLIYNLEDETSDNSPTSEPKAK